MTIPSEAKKQFKDKSCLICSNSYTPTGRCSKYCKPCSKEHFRKKAAAYQQAHRIKHGLVEKPGVGKGGNVKTGKDHHSYTSGIGCHFQNIRKRIKDTRRFCERCSKDLLDVSKYEWCLHHIDHDRANNVDSNFELLCKRCHQIEHECHKAFLNV